MPLRPLRPLSVFAVEDTAAQVCWSQLSPGTHRVEARGAYDAEVTVTSTGGPGAAVLEALRPGTRYELLFDGRRVGRFRTLPSPPGRLLCRVAMVSDIHVGDRRFGTFPTITEARRPGVEPFPLRCARAAITEAIAWGAEAVVVKGDLTRTGHREEFEAVGRLMASFPVPFIVVPGNHDLRASSLDPVAALARHGVALPTRPEAVDMPGLRLVLGLTARRRLHGGRVDDTADAIAALAGDAPGGAVVVLHHHLQRLRFAGSWPPGVPGPQSRALLDALAAANPASMVTSGHTHRYRRRSHGPVLVTTTGSPKDYPGAWAGLAVHEGGVRQVVRRVAAPDCMAWTERTGQTLAGAWALCSPGLLADRCFTHAWPSTSFGRRGVAWRAVRGRP